MRPPPVLEISNLGISYSTRAGEVEAVTDFNLILERGETVGIIGESGCGKSSVAMAIMRYLSHNARIVKGSIRFKGRDMASLSNEELRQVRCNGIAMVYQEPMASLNPSLTIAKQLVEVLALHANSKPLDKRQTHERAMQILQDVNLPDTARIMRSYPHQLSGGQQQRVVIAMALLSQPDLLVLDEPTTALDVTVEAGIVDLIREIAKKHNTAIIYISHNLGLILETCSRVHVMYAGQVIESGPIQQVFEQPRHPYTQGLLDCIALPTANRRNRPLRPIPGQVPAPRQRPNGCTFGPRCHAFKPGHCDTLDIVMSMVNPKRTVRCLRWQELDLSKDRAPLEPPPVVQRGAAVLKVEGLQKHYEVENRSFFSQCKPKGVVKAVQDISFTAHASETIAIVGESGCGKSTLAKVLMGLEIATKGKVKLKGQDMAQVPVTGRNAKQRASLQMVFQNPFDTLNPSLSIGFQLGRMLRKSGVTSTGHTTREGVARLLQEVKLPSETATQYPRQLSGGQKQRIGIARAFAGNPEVVVADEPVSALDVSVGASVTQLLMNIQLKHQTSMLFISHDLGLVRYLADRVVVIYLGRVVEEGSTDAVFAPPYHPYTEALISSIPVADTRVRKQRILLKGEIPSAVKPPKGCPFNTRCPRKLGAICEQQVPPMQLVRPGHRIACHISVKELAKVEPVFDLKPATGATSDTAPSFLELTS